MSMHLEEFAAAQGGANTLWAPDTLDSTRLSFPADEEGATAFNGVRQAILSQLQEARSLGIVHWESDEVMDRQVPIGDLVGRVRHAPSFAFRDAIYRPGGCGCPLCNPGGRQIDAADLAAERKTDAPKGFAEAFDAYPNNFPFLEGQVLLVSHEHRADLSRDQYKRLFVFMERTGFAGAALQLEGSGASIPGHAHVSVFDEPLPIFSSEYRELREKDGVTVAVSAEHPSVCYKISGEAEADAKPEQTLSIMERLDKLGLSYNFYLDGDGNAYIIPRTHRNSPTLRGKVGLSLAAGTYNAYGNGRAADLQTITDESLENYERITGERIAAALSETTVQGENPAVILV